MIRQSLAREIGAALAFKAAAIAVLYFLFFDHGRRTKVTPEKMTAVLLDRQTPAGR
jgi:hypothetical protein